MSKKTFNNRLLLGVLVALTIIYFATNFMQNQQRSSATDLPSFFNLPAESISTIKIKPISGDSITLIKGTDNEWTVSEGNKSAQADAETVASYLSTLTSIEAQRLVSKNADRWKDFNLTDSTALKVTIRSNDSSEEALLVGRFSYQQSSRSRNGQSYVRSANSDISYVVEGFLGASLNKGIDSWRNQRVLNFKTSDVQDAIWFYPADSGFVVNSASGNWKVDAQKADSVKVTKFFNGLQNKRYGTFEYELAKPNAEGMYQFVVNLINGESIRIKAWPIEGDEENFLIHSSLNEGALFRSTKSALFDDLFPGKNQFLE